MTDGNTVDYIKQNPKHIVTQVTENGKIYYVCSVCGRKSFRKTMTRDDKIKANIERKNHLMKELNRLRGEQDGRY